MSHMDWTQWPDKHITFIVIREQKYISQINGASVLSFQWVGEETKNDWLTKLDRKVSQCMRFTFVFVLIT